MGKYPQKKLYGGLDVMKFVCALLIVYMHTYNHDFGIIGEWIWLNLTPIGVPFFFIVSGYLYARGLQSSESPRNYLFNYLKRVFGMYVFWSLLTLPVAWMNIGIAHSDYGFLMKVLYVFRCFFFTGSLGIYWYVLSLVYNSIIMYYAYKYGKLSFLYILSIVFFVIGVLYQGGCLKETSIGVFIHVVIGSERNALNVGLLYMCIGMFLWNHHYSVKQPILFFLLVLSIILGTYFNMITSYAPIQVPIAVLLFMLAIQGNWVKHESLSLRMRKWSTALYLGQFPFILVFDYYLKRGSLIDVPLTILFSIVLYYAICFILPNRYVKYIYG